MQHSTHPQQPCFQLRQVTSDGRHTERICSLTEFLESASKVHLNRRAFLGVSSLTMLAALAACSSEERGDTLGEATEAPQPTADVVEQVAVSAPEMDCEQIRAHVDSIFDLRFSPDSRLLVSTSADNSLKLWDLESRDPPVILDQQEDTLTSPIYTQDGKRLYWLWPPQRVLKGYELETREEIEPLEGLGGKLWAAAFNPDETLMAVAGENLIELWDFPARKRLWGTPIETIFIGLAYSPQDDRLYTGDLDGFIRQWDMESGEMLDEMISESGIVLGLSISPDGKYLAWGGTDDNFLHLWDLAAGEEIERWNAPGSIASLTAFSPDGRWLVVSGGWNEIAVIDFTTLRQEYLLSTHGNEIRALSFSPDSQLLAAGTDIGSIVFWNTDSFERINDTPDDCLFDPDAAPAGDEFNTVRVTAADGITRTYTLPCGSPIPAGAICTCDCVPGTFAGELPTTGGSRPSGGSSGSGCSCNEVCSCVPVCVCMAV